MAERLCAQETAIWTGEVSGLPAQVGGVAVFRGDCEADRAVALIAERLAIVPRYRQKVRPVPGGIAQPVWIDDDQFDLSYHIRRSALPRPGTEQQLREFVGRVLSRGLDRNRPLWEAYLVEGLRIDGQLHWALVTKTHLTLINGVGDVSLEQILLDDQPPSEPSAEPHWDPAPVPTNNQLFVDALVAAAADPLTALGSLGQQAGVLAGSVVEWGESLGALPSGLADRAAAALRGDENSALIGPVGSQRRWSTAEIKLARIKALRAGHEVTINDLVLAIVTGALRLWLTNRGVEHPADVRAVVPMSVPDIDGEPTALGSRVAPHVMVLPVPEPDPVMRLHQVCYGTSAHTDSGRFVSARQLVDIAGFAPGTLHALGMRESRRVLRRQHDVVVINAPGPQDRRYLAGMAMVASFPVLPLTAGHLLAIGVTSYDGVVYLGFTADRDRIADVDDLAGFVAEAVDELLICDARATAWAEQCWEDFS